MKVAIIAVLVVLVATVRVWFHRRAKRSAGSSRARETFERLVGDVGLVAAREVRERTRGRIFRVGTLLILLAVAAGIVIPVIHSSKPNVQKVGVVGALPTSLRTAVAATSTSIHASVSLTSEPNIGTANGDLRSGRVNLVIVDAQKLVTEKAVQSGDTSTTALLMRAVSSVISLHTAFEAAGITPAQAATLARSTPAPVSSLEPAHVHGPARALPSTA